MFRAATRIIDVHAKGVSKNRSARELQQRLAHMEIAMEFTEDAVQLLANAPKTKQYGARPMKQYLAQMVENTIADKMLRSEVQSGDEICLTAKERRFVVLDKVLPTR